MSDIEQIRRAHASAKPKPSNPAWCNAHRDLGVALEEIEHMQKVIDRTALQRLDLEAENRRLSAEVKSSFEDGWNAYADLIMEDRIEMEREEAWEKRVSGRE